MTAQPALFSLACLWRCNEMTHTSFSPGTVVYAAGAGSSHMCFLYTWSRRVSSRVVPDPPGVWNRTSELVDQLTPNTILAPRGRDDRAAFVVPVAAEAATS